MINNLEFKTAVETAYVAVKGETSAISRVACLYTDIRDTLTIYQAHRKEHIRRAKFHVSG